MLFKIQIWPIFSFQAELIRLLFKELRYFMMRWTQVHKVLAREADSKHNKSFVMLNGGHEWILHRLIHNVIPNLIIVSLKAHSIRH